MKQTLLFARRKNLERTWPFVPEPLLERMQQLGPVTVVQVEADTPLSQVADLRDVAAIALFGGRLTEACLQQAPALRAIGGVFDNWARSLPTEYLFARDIAIIDATRAWAPSVAECALGLALSALRRLPHWHMRMANREGLWDWEYGQFCDDPQFVNGTLGTKCVGVIGLGQIGSRIAQWCHALGARVLGYDPFLPLERFQALNVTPVEMDQMVTKVEVLFVATPPTPSARGLLSAERIGRLQQGALVVVVTRAHAVDMDALRRRIVANELAGAFDVYDIEPLPVDDPLRGRPNVVHLPHIAGRTRDANLLVAQIIADDFARILRGEPPQARLTREAIAVRAERVDLPEQT